MEGHMDANKVIAALDADLARQEQNIGIRMGLELYKECLRRGLIRPEIFLVQETGLSAQEISVYNRRHVVIYWPDLTDWQYHVGPRTP
jgi:hypothetical protein